jgi:hypothetical protein
MDKMEALIQFVRNHATRGACKCGRCIVSDGTAAKPSNHTVNLTFFEVGMYGDPDAEIFKKLAQEAGVTPPAGHEVSYIQIGGSIGDQGTALLTMGLGHLLGAWKVLSPDLTMPSLPKDLKMKMAGQGMVSILREKEKKPAPTPAAVTIVPPAPPMSYAEEVENDIKLAEAALADSAPRRPYEEVAEELGLHPKPEGRRRGKKESS